MKTFHYNLTDKITAEHTQLENGIHVVTIQEDGYYVCGCTRATAFEAQKYISEQEKYYKDIIKFKELEEEGEE